MKACVGGESGDWVGRGEGVVFFAAMGERGFEGGRGFFAEGGRSDWGEKGGSGLDDHPVALILARVAFCWSRRSA